MPNVWIYSRKKSAELSRPQDFLLTKQPHTIKTWPLIVTNFRRKFTSSKRFCHRGIHKCYSARKSEISVHRTNWQSDNDYTDNVNVNVKQLTYTVAENVQHMKKKTLVLLKRQKQPTSPELSKFSTFACFLFSFAYINIEMLSKAKLLDSESLSFLL